MRRLLAGLVVLLALGHAGAAGAQSQAAAQTPTAAAADVHGRRVTAVRILLDGLPATDPDLPPLLDIVVGEPLDPAQVRSSIEHLSHLRRFAAIDVLADPAPDGIVVRVELTSEQRDQLILLEFTQSDRLSWIVSQNEDDTYAIDVRVRHIF